MCVTLQPFCLLKSNAWRTNNFETRNVFFRSIKTILYVATVLLSINPHLISPLVLHVCIYYCASLYYLWKILWHCWCFETWALQYYCRTGIPCNPNTQLWSSQPYFENYLPEGQKDKFSEHLFQLAIKIFVLFVTWSIMNEYGRC